MMNPNALDPNQRYLFLDTDAERAQLIASIAQARDAVRDLAAGVPEAEWYAPRYHGWSLAAMLAHLNLSDNVAMLLHRLALLGLHPKITRGSVNRANAGAARLFQRRLVPSSLRSMARNQARIIDFITTLPMDKLSRTVHHPIVGPLTLERSLQEFFVHHWEEHLTTMRMVEGIGQGRAGGA